MVSPKSPLNIVKGKSPPLTPKNCTLEYTLFEWKGAPLKADSTQTFWTPAPYSVLLSEGLAPSPFVFQGESGG